MIQVQAYRCSDGTIKTSKVEALTHERNLKIKSIFIKRMGGTQTMMSMEQAAAIVGNYMKEFLEPHKECEKELNRMAALQRRRERETQKKVGVVVGG